MQWIDVQLVKWHSDGEHISSTTWQFWKTSFVKAFVMGYIII